MSISEDSIELTEGHNQVNGTLYDLYLYLRADGQEKDHSEMMLKVEKNISVLRGLGTVEKSSVVCKEKGQTIETYKMSGKPLLAFTINEDMKLASEMVDGLD